MNIFVIGCGRWGSLIAWYLDRTGHGVTLYGRPGSRHMQRFLATRRNDLLELPESIRLSTDLSCLRQAEIVVISIGSQVMLTEICAPLAPGSYCPATLIFVSAVPSFSASAARAGAERPISSAAASASENHRFIWYPSFYDCTVTVICASVSTIAFSPLSGS